MYFVIGLLFSVIYMYLSNIIIVSNGWTRDTALVTLGNMSYECQDLFVAGVDQMLFTKMHFNGEDQSFNIG